MNKFTVEINEMIAKNAHAGNMAINTNDISDGYHTFGELYQHRIALFKALCRICGESWKSQSHSDGTEMIGWFVLGLNKSKGEQITYHLPMSEWDNCDFAEILSRAAEWDGHTSNDVLKRIDEIV